MTREHKAPQVAADPRIAFLRCEVLSIIFYDPPCGFKFTERKASECAIDHPPSNLCSLPFLLDCPIPPWALSFAVTHQIRSVTVTASQSQFTAAGPASGGPSHCQCGPR